MSKLSRDEKRRKKEEAKQAKAERKARQAAVESDGSLLISMLIVLLVLVGIWNFAMVGVIGFSYTRAARERTAALSQSVPPAASQSTLSVPSGNSPGGATGISTPVNTPSEPSATPKETGAPEPEQDTSPESPLPVTFQPEENPNQSEPIRATETPENSAGSGSAENTPPPTAPAADEPVPPAANHVGSGGEGNTDNFNLYDNPDQQNTDADYVLNTSTMKFHYPTCGDVRSIKEENYSTFTGARSDLISMDYSPCGHCNP